MNSSHILLKGGKTKVFVRNSDTLYPFETIAVSLVSACDRANFPKDSVRILYTFFEMNFSLIHFVFSRLDIFVNLLPKKTSLFGTKKCQDSLHLWLRDFGEKT